MVTPTSQAFTLATIRPSQDCAARFRLIDKM